MIKINKAFTIIEVLVATLILVVGVLGVFKLLYMSKNTSERSEHLTKAILLSEKIITDLELEAFNSDTTCLKHMNKRLEKFTIICENINELSKKESPDKPKYGLLTKIDQLDPISKKPLKGFIRVIWYKKDPQKDETQTIITLPFVLKPTPSTVTTPTNPPIIAQHQS